MRKATRTQWIKCSIAILLYLIFLIWVKSWWGLIVVPFIFDIYITKKIPWSFWKKSKNPTVRSVMSCRCHRFRFGSSIFRKHLCFSELSDPIIVTGKIAAGWRLPLREQNELRPPCAEHTAINALGTTYIADSEY